MVTGDGKFIGRNEDGITTRNVQCIRRNLYFICKKLGGWHLRVFIFDDFKIIVNLASSRKLKPEKVRLSNDTYVIIFTRLNVIYGLVRVINCQLKNSRCLLYLFNRLINQFYQNHHFSHCLAYIFESSLSNYVPKSTLLPLAL